MLLLALAFPLNLASVYLYATIYGVAWGMRGPLIVAILAAYFGPASFGLIMGFSFTLATVGTTLRPLFASLFADRTGNYETAFAVLAAVAVSGSSFFAFAARPQLPACLFAQEEASTV